MKAFLLVIFVPLVIHTLALETIQSLEELENRGFNDRTRHGFALFVWLSLVCVDKNMRAKCDPTRGDYGFHTFYNREGLLPKIREGVHTYYTIGNLNEKGGKHLPQHIRSDFNSKNPNSNKDRVVVRYNNYNRQIEEIYITAHYKPEETYKIHPRLIKNVQMFPPHPSYRSPKPGPSTPPGPSLLSGSSQQPPQSPGLPKPGPSTPLGPSRRNNQEQGDEALGATGGALETEATPYSAALLAVFMCPASFATRRKFQ